MSGICLPLDSFSFWENCNVGTICSLNMEYSERSSKKSNPAKVIKPKSRENSFVETKKFYSF